MKYHQIRNATCVLEFDEVRVLVDPMLGDPGTLPPYAVIRSRAQRNPLTPLPSGWERTLEGVDACVITHMHFGVDCDHLDSAGAAWLRAAGSPIYCRAGDGKRLRKRDLGSTPVSAEPTSFLGGTIQAIKASHGRGLIGKLMGPGVGYVIRLPNEPVVYLTGDTVLTDAVREALKEHSPDVCIVPGGGARLDLGGPVLMSQQELVEFVSLVPGHLVMNHIGALNHCPTTRDDIASWFDSEQLSRISVPLDGEVIHEFTSA